MDGIAHQNNRSLMPGGSCGKVVNRIHAKFSAARTDEVVDKRLVAAKEGQQPLLPDSMRSQGQLRTARFTLLGKIAEPPDFTRLLDKVTKERPLAKDKMLRVRGWLQHGTVRKTAATDQSGVGRVRCAGVDDLASARVNTVAPNQAVALCGAAVGKMGNDPALGSNVNIRQLLAPGNGDALTLHFCAQQAVQSGAITGVIDRLEKAGLAQRTTDPQDRRRVVVQLLHDPERERAINQLYVEMGEAITQLLLSYSAEKRLTIAEFLTKATAIMETATRNLRQGA